MSDARQPSHFVTSKTSTTVPSTVSPEATTVLMTTTSTLRIERTTPVSSLYCRCDARQPPHFVTSTTSRRRSHASCCWWRRRTRLRQWIRFMPTLQVCVRDGDVARHLVCLRVCIAHARHILRAPLHTRVVAENRYQPHFRRGADPHAGVATGVDAPNVSNSWRRTHTRTFPDHTLTDLQNPDFWSVCQTSNQFQKNLLSAILDKKNRASQLDESVGCLRKISDGLTNLEISGKKGPVFRGQLLWDPGSAPIAKSEMQHFDAP